MADKTTLLADLIAAARPVADLAIGQKADRPDYVTVVPVAALHRLRIALYAYETICDRCGEALNLARPDGVLLCANLNCPPPADFILARITEHVQTRMVPVGCCGWHREKLLGMLGDSPAPSPSFSQGAP